MNTTQVKSLKDQPSYIQVLVNNLVKSSRTLKYEIEEGISIKIPSLCRKDKSTNLRKYITIKE